MAGTTVNNWTMTRDDTTGNYTLTCMDSNFNTQEKKIQVDCGNRNMTGDLIVDVKAKTGSVSIPNKYFNHTSTSSSYNPHTTFTYSDTYAYISIPSESLTITPTVTSGWVNSVSSASATAYGNTYYIYSMAKDYTKKTSPIETNTSGNIGDNLNIGYVYSYQMIQSLNSESTGQHCWLYAKGFYDSTSAATSINYNGGSGYCLKGIDDGDLLICKYDTYSGGYYYWKWYLLRTDGTQTLFGRTRGTNSTYSYIYDVRLDKESSASEKVMIITLGPRIE